MSFVNYIYVSKTGHSCHPVGPFKVIHPMQGFIIVYRIDISTSTCFQTFNLAGNYL